MKKWFAGAILTILTMLSSSVWSAQQGASLALSFYQGNMLSSFIQFEQSATGMMGFSTKAFDFGFGFSTLGSSSLTTIMGGLKNRLEPNTYVKYGLTYEADSPVNVIGFFLGFQRVISDSLQFDMLFYPFASYSNGSTTTTAIGSNATVGVSYLLDLK